MRLQVAAVLKIVAWHTPRPLGILCWQPNGPTKDLAMATKRRGRQSKNDSPLRLNDLMERLSAHLSQDEIKNIFGRSLIALDPAGIERMAAGLDTGTAGVVSQVLKPPWRSKKTQAASP